ncbi:MAG: amino acid racemase [Bacteroidota bacterium]
MKKIGLIGGTGWASTKIYYERINTLIHSACGGRHSAECIIYSFDFENIYHLQKQDKWDLIEDLLADKSNILTNAGAECLAVCANTLHRSVGKLKLLCRIPFVDIRDACVSYFLENRIQSVYFFGTGFSVINNIYSEPFARNNIRLLDIDKDVTAKTDQIIYNELVFDRISDDSIEFFRETFDELSENKDAVIMLGCTELNILNKIFNTFHFADTLEIHANAIVSFSLEQD